MGNSSTYPKITMKSHIYNEVLAAVVAVTEIEGSRILSHEKQADVVEARCLLFHFLQEQGFYPSEIARFTGQSRQCVAMLLNTYDIRRKYRGKMLSIFERDICKMLSLM